MRRELSFVWKEVDLFWKAGIKKVLKEVGVQMVRKQS